MVEKLKRWLFIRYAIYFHCELVCTNSIELQKIYRNNRTRGGYSLTELELPGARQRTQAPASVLAGMAHTMNLVRFLYNFLYDFTYFEILVLWKLCSNFHKASFYDNY